MKIRPLGAELFHADRVPNGKTDMMKLIVSSCSYTKAPNRK